ncbi:hypothetical protein VTL71DRAFT_10321 [Oculimacula yallundae]|uniref:F5/8 type C domain-containing protein n=1 Tax=Oculimacula yallundae TaxID=86028 RepID=A0ABR4CT76_9HELO
MFVPCLAIVLSFWRLAEAVSIVVSDAQTSMGNVGNNAIDLNNATFWHSQYKPTAIGFPHTATLDLGSVTSIRGFTYLPRQDVTNSKNGNIGQHDVQISTDGTTWTTVIAKGVYPDTRDPKLDSFSDIQARYVKLIAYTEAGNRGPWTSAAELGVIFTPSYTLTSTNPSSSSTSSSSKISSSTISSIYSTQSTATSVSSTTSTTASNVPTVSAALGPINVDSFQTGNEGTKAIDGVRSTFWHSKYKPDAVPLPHNAVLDLGSTPVQVTGFTYLPRQDVAAAKPLNGNIGQYKIETSTDDTNWILATNGTYKDDATLKTSSFPSRLARYVRITALTEAGNRGPWTSAAEFGVLALYNSSAPAVPSLGKWGPVIPMPIVSAGAFIVPESGNVITFSRSGKKDNGAMTGNTYTSTYNFATGNVSLRNVMETKHDMFCPGQSRDFRGRTFLSGGDDASRVSIYEPGSDTWVVAPQMNLLRGYQSSTTLSDGRTFVIGGSWLVNTSDRGGKNAEVFDEVSNTWTLLPGCPVAPMLTDDNNGIYREDSHGWIFSWSNSSVFQAGPSKAMNWYSALGNGSTVPAGTRGTNDAMCGIAALYDAVAGKIFTAGGAQSYENAPATNAAHLITIGSPNNAASVITLPTMNYARSFANGVILPDGTVFIIGGQPYPVTFTDTNAVMTPELWNPVNQTFTMLPVHQIPRTYHSIALLLLDGTVFTAGGGLCGNCATNHLDAEIYSPGYLFNPDGSAATRPVITSVSNTVNVGGTLTVVTDSSVTRLSLVRYGSVTHTVDTDQRRIPFDSVSGTTNTITVPSDPGVALPGYWMLFAINAKGVPSIAKTVKITP